MQLSQRKLNRSIEKQLKEMLWKAFAEIKSPDQIKQVLDDLLTETERIAVYKRLGIALYLDKGRSYEDIKNNIKVSSATIASVANDMGNPGLGEVIKRIKAEEWANEWTEKISKGIKKIIPAGSRG